MFGFTTVYNNDSGNLDSYLFQWESFPFANAILDEPVITQPWPCWTMAYYPSSSQAWPCWTLPYFAPTVRPREGCVRPDPHHPSFLPYDALQSPGGLTGAPWEQQMYYCEMSRAGRGKRNLPLVQDPQVEEAWHPHLRYGYASFCRVFDEIRRIKILGEDPPILGVIHKLWTTDPQTTYVETLERRLNDMLSSFWTERRLLDHAEREAAESLNIPPELGEGFLHLASVELEPEDFEPYLYLPDEGDWIQEGGFLDPQEEELLLELEALDGGSNLHRRPPGT